MKTDLKTQVHVKESFQKLEKDSHRAQHNADTGFEFEWYQRYPRMQQQNRDIRNIQKEQRFHDKQRIQQAALEEKKKPPSVLSPQEYDRIAKESKQELYEAKTEMQKSLKKDYDTTLKSSKTASALAKQQKIQEENAQLERTRKNIQAEKFHLGQQKRQRNLEMNQALNSVDTKKRAEWKDKVNDHSNQELTEKLQHEKQRLVDDLANERSKMKQDYSQSLSKQSYHNKEKKLRDIKEQKAGYKGINFECYARDIVMRKERLNANEYNKVKRVKDIWNKAIEKEEINRPPPTLEQEAMKRSTRFH
ncbi:unnamed protein product [Moneuplotes crassus]|uniref:Uncharacterized protein n=1 Tax=Euplotes crassus TaxID=5936 RepID=A0AAD1ULC7_EUPCR|nr:unnamed protein product [Moneuplotes crassus]